VRLAARECAGDATAELVFEAVVDATRERALRDNVLWLSRACLRRSRILEESRFVQRAGQGFHGDFAVCAYKKLQVFVGSSYQGLDCGETR